MNRMFGLLLFGMPVFTSSEIDVQWVTLWLIRPHQLSGMP